MVGKGEIARYEQFLLFPQCFLKTCTEDTYKPGLVWERLNPFCVYRYELALSNLVPKQALDFTCLQCKSFENTWGKGEILLPTVLPSVLEKFPSFSSNLHLLSPNSFSLEECKICRLGKS